MLKLQFINVGNGDATLIEQVEDGWPFRILIDTGRPDVGASEGSLRQTCTEYLRGRGIRKIDVLVITHLHMDHFGGLRDLIGEVEFGDLYAGFIPGLPGQCIPEEPDAVKTVRGMIDCVNRWSADVAALCSTGCRPHEVGRSVRLDLPGNLSVEIIGSDAALHRLQRTVWNGMATGQSFTDDEKYRASKSRNPGSLRVRLRYAGREIEIAGDRYGELWENAATPCDILKVPHHGDAKSMTPQLTRNLRPRYAVISCMREYVEKKDRPSMQAIRLLRENGARVWFTDAFDDGKNPPRFHRAVEFLLTDDGIIHNSNQPGVNENDYECTV